MAHADGDAFPSTVHEGRGIGPLAVVEDRKSDYAGVQVTGVSGVGRVKLGIWTGALIGYGAGGMQGARPGARAEMIAQTIEQHDFGLDLELVRQIAESVPPRTVVSLILKHLWAKRFKEIALNQEGIRLAYGYISPQALAELGTRFAEGARVAAQLQAG